MYHRNLTYRELIDGRLRLPQHPLGLRRSPRQEQLHLPGEAAHVLHVHHRGHGPAGQGRRSRRGQRRHQDHHRRRAGQTTKIYS